MTTALFTLEPFTIVLLLIIAILLVGNLVPSRQPPTVVYMTTEPPREERAWGCIIWTVLGAIVFFALILA
jgi:hypothetical protein